MTATDPQNPGGIQPQNPGDGPQPDPTPDQEQESRQPEPESTPDAGQDHTSNEQNAEGFALPHQDAGRGSESEQQSSSDDNE